VAPEAVRNWCGLNKQISREAGEIFLDVFCSKLVWHAPHQSIGCWCGIRYSSHYADGVAFATPST